MRDCDAELQEMSQIEAFRRDEEQTPDIRVEPGKRPAEWLREKVYEPKKARTLDLVKRAVQALLETGHQVSLAAVARKTKEIDQAGLGVSESAVLTTQDAYAHYEQFRTQSPRPRRSASAPKPAPQEPRPVRADRNTVRVRQRYLHLTKAELADRLIAQEQAYRELHDRWLEAQHELLTLKLPKPPTY